MNRLLVVLACLAAPAAAQQPLPTNIPAQFRDFSGGYVDNVDASNLQRTESPDMLNVRIDDPIGSIRPRNGFVRCGNLPSGNIATNLYEYTRSDGTRRLIATDNQNVYSTPDCQSWTTITSSLSSSQQVYFATVRDKLWIVNGSTWPMTWDGTNFSLLDGRANTPNPAPPKCSFIEFWKERVWCGSPSGDASGVAFSALTDSGGNDLDPSTGTVSWPASNDFEIDQNAGSRIYGIKAYRNRLYAFKDNGVWEIGFDNDFNNFVRKTFATVGSRFQTSIKEVDGILYFTGRDGIYAFDGDNSVRVSRKIDHKFATLNQPLISQNYKTWDTNTDFEAGTFSSATDQGITGSVTISTRAALLDNGNFETGNLSSWTSYADAGAVVSTVAYAFSPGGSYAARVSAGLSGCTNVSQGVYLFNVSGTTLTSSVGFGGSGAEAGGSLDTSAYALQTVRVKFESVGSYGGNPHVTAQLWSSTFTAGADVTFDYVSNTNGGQCGFLELDNVSSFLYFSTGSWTSEIYNTVSVSTWGAITTNDSSNGGSLQYQIRYGTNTGAVQSMSFANITPGSLIPANTSQIYVQVRALFTASSDLKNSPEVDSVQLSWNSGGNNTQKIYAGEWQNQLWVSASSGTATSNNTVLQRAKAPLDAWMPHDMKIGPMTRYNDYFYAAASTHSAIYRMDYGTNDDGAAISWYWTSKDENWGIPNNGKQLSEIDADYRNNAACNIRVGYVQDQNTTYCVGTAPSPNATLSSGIGSRRLNFNGGPAYTYRFKVCDDQKDQAPVITGLSGWAKTIQRRGD